MAAAHNPDQYPFCTAEMTPAWTAQQLARQQRQVAAYEIPDTAAEPEPDEPKPAKKTSTRKKKA